MMALYLLPLGVRYVLSRVIGILGTLIFISSLASWIPQVRDSRVGSLLSALTEPIVGPVRQLLQRIPAMRRLPVDFSPLVTFALLQMISNIIWIL